MDASSRRYPKQGSCCAISRQYSEPCWKSQREEVVEASAAIRGNQGISSGWPGKSTPSSPFAPKKETGWKGCSQPSCSAGLLGTEHKKTSQGPPAASMRPESSPRTQEGLLCHVHAMQLLDREWLSQGDILHSAKSGHPQQLPRECNWRSQGSPTGWVEDGEQQNEERCSSLGGLANQAGNDWSNEEKPFYQHQPDGAQPLKSSCSSRNQDISLRTSKKQEPDLLNFKKGWMSILSKSGEWTKHWFLMVWRSLQADDLDGEIDLRSCTDVTEYAVQRNYGFQIHTKDGVFTLSAMTSGIRRNWIEALRKSIRPTSVPDVTKLSDSNKENAFRSYGSPKSSLRSEEQRASAGLESIPKGSSSSRKADGQRHAFDYVELSPLQQGSLSSLGSPQRTRGSARAADSKREELERDQALRSEERRRWFESTASGVLQTDGPVGEHGPKTGVPDSPGTPLTEAQRNRLSEEIERKWQELERLPLKDSKRVPLMALLNQAKRGREDASESLEKEVQLLRSQLESVHAQSEAKSHRDMQIPRGYISQEACERNLAEMENAHQQVMAELQRHHQWEMERLKQEKEQLLSEEAAATAAAIEALKKAHREELNKELSRTRGFQRGFSDMNTLQQQHQSDVESLKRELQVLSEQYSQKCLQIGDLVQKAEEQEQMLQHCQQEGKELLRQNQELQRRLSEEIGQLRAFIATQSSRDGASRNNERSSCELEVLLRVKENELQYLKQEVQCLRDELQMMQKDKKFASRKYQDVYVELNHIKQRSEREIEQLKEHLRLAMAALQEKEILHNSVG
ncbi:hypothetical protein JRQ81_016283 [Phrynocephalus forsythii]|uniref:PH domain-containing protein n=1 Tax=Phrynocephalus forsythii TaxID=171643 RepID=A0A9Q1B2X0_9SAUR|nr:hypothetical protein JRQ81_016283 [Phrynocephalus forsythii]